MEIEIGTHIGFKSDVEQSAEVIEIKRRASWEGGNIYVVKAPVDGFQGEYLKRSRTAEIYEDEIF